ncbi:hypothetical protein JOQ06_023700 [Pogonophryne albipinna]|uniref:Uncharacterized protein n=1 Tax=Pogonophryne albipinna TaxID=1090488 RepID=A0AAD6FU54_9TELE|nr:hypothetical protein JOQ06_023700 [Pogonophryne albipinna]
MCHSAVTPAVIYRPDRKITQISCYKSLSSAIRGDIRKLELCPKDNSDSPHLVNAETLSPIHYGQFVREC